MRMSEAWEESEEENPRRGEEQIPNYELSAREERGDSGINPRENHSDD